METTRLTNQELNDLAGIILDAAITVHRAIGPGLLESVYQECLVMELRKRAIKVEREVHVQLHYQNEPIDKEYKIDLLVENEIILELKSVEFILKVHEAQIVSYLRLSNRKLGFLINFNVPLLKQGFKRFVNNF
ncbi:MAG TPA: GxxExxY protein [Chryseosolibacter sp.]